MKNKLSSEFPIVILPTQCDNRYNWQSVLLACLLFLWETIVVYCYWTLIFGGLLCVLLHLCGVAAAYFLFHYAYKQQQDLRFPLFLLLSVFGAGPFGVAGFLLLALFYPLLSKVSTPFMKWFADLFPEHFLSPAMEVYQRLRAGWDDYSQIVEVTPFMDIFHYGTLSQKQAVLDAIVKDFDPIYSSILKAGLQDPSNMVRLQAAAIVSKIDVDFESELKKILTERSYYPKDSSLLLKIAQLLDRHAFSNLLDTQSERTLQEQALQYYQEYLQLHPEDVTSSYALVRLLFRLHRFEEVVAWFEKREDELALLPGNLLSWYFESLYQLKHFSRLAERAKTALNTLQKETLSTEVAETIETWARTS